MDDGSTSMFNQPLPMNPNCRWSYRERSHCRFLRLIVGSTDIKHICFPCFGSFFFKLKIPMFLKSAHCPCFAKISHRSTRESWQPWKTWPVGHRRHRGPWGKQTSTIWLWLTKPWYRWPIEIDVDSMVIFHGYVVITRRENSTICRCSS